MLFVFFLFQPKKKGKAGAKGKSKGKKKGGGGKKKGKKGVKAAASEKALQPIADPLSHVAMLNAYYISHGPVEFLQFRGYSWSGGGAKKKKKGGGKKKKKK